MNKIIIEYGSYTNIKGYYIQVKNPEMVVSEQYRTNKKAILELLSDYKKFYKNNKITIIDNFWNGGFKHVNNNKHRYKRGLFIFC